MIVAPVLTVQALVLSLVSMLVLLVPVMADDKTGNDFQSPETLLSMQARAWNDGDLDKFMTGYLDSEDISYSSGGVEVWGYKALRARYEKRYGADKSSMGKLSFRDLKTSKLGSKNAYCIGHWHLERTSEPPLDGTFTLILVKTDKGWKVIHDHTSVLNKEPAQKAGSS